METAPRGDDAKMEKSVPKIGSVYRFGKTEIKIIQVNLEEKKCKVSAADVIQFGGSAYISKWDPNREITFKALEGWALIKEA